MGKRKHSETDDNLSTASTEILEELSDYEEISDEDMSFFGVDNTTSKEKQLTEAVNIFTFSSTKLSKIIVSTHTDGIVYFLYNNICIFSTPKGSKIELVKL